MSTTASQAGQTASWRGRLIAFLAEYCESPQAVIAAVVLLAVIVAAAFAPLLSPQDPYDMLQLNILDARLEPGSRSMGGFTFWLGSDNQGRDLLSAIFYGLRISLGVAVTSVFAAAVIGLSVGLIAAYVGGRLDAVVMRVVDMQLSFPAILIALILLAVLGQGAEKIVLALIIVQWAYFARTARGAALVECQRDYVEAARCLALPHWRIVFRHILPNVMAPIIVVGTIQAAQAVALEATLSFLGLGLPVTEPSLGLLIANGFNYIISGRYWISFYPGIALIVTIFALNIVGDRLRDVLNPRLKR